MWGVVLCAHRLLCPGRALAPLTGHNLQLLPNVPLHMGTGGGDGCHPLLPLTLTSPGRKLCASEGWVGQDSCSSRHSSVWHPWHEAVETQSVCPHFFQVTPL